MPKLLKHSLLASLAGFALLVGAAPARADMFVFIHESNTSNYTSFTVTGNTINLTNLNGAALGFPDFNILSIVGKANVPGSNVLTGPGAQVTARVDAVRTGADAGKNESLVVQVEANDFKFPNPGRYMRQQETVGTLSGDATTVATAGINRANGQNVRNNPSALTPSFFFSSPGSQINDVTVSGLNGTARFALAGWNVMTASVTGSELKYTQIVNVFPVPKVIPEPASLALASIGFSALGLGFFRRKLRKQ